MISMLLLLKFNVKDESIESLDNSLPNSKMFSMLLLLKFNSKN